MTANAEVRPAAALLHPAWLVALVLLALNDHVLKGGLHAPSLLVGKLSDIAGLLVAPALFAALLRVRSLRGLFAAHLAVGLVFAAIQLSPAAAAAWSALMAGLGAPWKITSDPGDLLTLPSLLLSWRLFVPVMRGAPPIIGLRRLATATAGSIGLLFCVATSPPPETIPYDPLNTDVYIHNDTGERLVLIIRQLRADLETDCEVVTTAPELLREPHFGEPATWSLGNQVNAAALPIAGDPAPTRPCRAILLTSDTMAPTIVTWARDDLPLTIQPGVVHGEDHAEGALLISDDDGDTDLTPIGAMSITPLGAGDSDQAPNCPAQSELDRLFWSAPVPTGIAQLTEVDLGADGCYALGLDGARWYLCAPAPLFPFQVGDWVSLKATSGTSSDTVQLDLLDGPGGEPATPARRLIVSRGDGFPFIPGLSGEPSAQAGCTYQVSGACAAVTRPIELLVNHGDGATNLTVGAPVSVPDGLGGVWTLDLAYAQRPAFFDPACDEGDNRLTDHIDLAALYSP
jgi:hypothetical protein